MSGQSIAHKVRLGVISLSVVTLIAVITILVGYSYISLSQSKTLRAQKVLLAHIDNMDKPSTELGELVRGLDDVDSDASLQVLTKNSEEVFRQLKQSLGESFGTLAAPEVLDYRSQLSLSLSQFSDTFSLGLSQTSEVIRIAKRLDAWLGAVYKLQAQTRFDLENKILEANLTFYKLGNGLENSDRVKPELLQAYARIQRLLELKLRVDEFEEQLRHVEQASNSTELSGAINELSLTLRNFSALAVESASDVDIKRHARLLNDSLNHTSGFLSVRRDLLEAKDKKNITLKALDGQRGEIIDFVRQYRENSIYKNVSRTDDLRKKTVAMSIFVVVLLVLAILVYTYFFRILIYNKLITPVLEMTRVTHELGSGNLAIDIPAYNATELKDMAQALDILRDKSRMLEVSNKALIQANDDVESFAYAASHDLKSPLRGIAHLTEFLIEDLYDDLDSESKANLLQINIRVKRLEALLTDLLNYAQHQNEDNDVTRIEAKSFLSELFSLLDADDCFILNIESDAEYLHTYVTPLRQVIHNLIDNAMKHHDKDHGTISLGVFVHDKRYRIYVEDDGPGIDNKYRDKIFRPFQTLRSRDEVEGSGMGLALVRRIVKRQNGHINIVARPDGERGARFEFDWPRRGT